MNGMRPLLFGADTLTRTLLYVVIIAGIIMGCIGQRWLFIGLTVLLWLIYLGCRIFVSHRLANELNERRYNVSLPLFDIIHPLCELFYNLRMRLSSKRMHMRKV